MAKRIEITVPDELWDRIEAARVHPSGAFIPRAAFVKRALERALSPDPLNELEDRLAAEGVPRLKEATREMLQTPVEKGPEEHPAGRQGQAPSRPTFRCRSCEFVALSEKARCPRHGGALVPV